MMYIMMCYAICVGICIHTDIYVCTMRDAKSIKSKVDIRGRKQKYVDREEL